MFDCIQTCSDAFGGSEKFGRIQTDDAQEDDDDDVVLKLVQFNRFV